MTAPRSEPVGDRLLRAACVLSIALPIVLLAVFVAITASDASRDFVDTRAIARILFGSAELVLLTMALAAPVGVGAALWLEEYAVPGTLRSIVERSLATLAGVPSILHGLLGFVLFSRALGLHRGPLAAAATLAIVLLPMVIASSREALRAVPATLREASTALGADRLQALRHVVLPNALPGIVTGIVLSLARAAGETAPLLALGLLASHTGQDPVSSASTLPTAIFGWISRAGLGDRSNAAAGILALLALVLALHGLALFLRLRFGKTNTRLEARGETR